MINFKSNLMIALDKTHRGKIWAIISVIIFIFFNLARHEYIILNNIWIRIALFVLLSACTYKSLSYFYKNGFASKLGNALTSIGISSLGVLISNPSILNDIDINNPSSILSIISLLSFIIGLILSRH